MSRKLTYEFVRKEFGKRNYKLIDTVYKNAGIKLNYICPNGHKHNIKWGHFKNGHGCPYCAKRPPITIDFVREEFEKENYKVLTKKYKNADQKLDYICPNGHKHSITWNNWNNYNQRCAYCSGKGKPTIDFIKKEFKKENYILLTKKYKNAHQKLNYICPNNHQHNISWANWKNGQRCYYCFGTIPHTIDFIKKEFEKEGYKLLSKSYKNSQTKLIYECNKGHRHNISWAKWQQGQRCPFCYNLNRQGENHPMYGKCGPLAPNWKGGISCEPYCQDWTKQFKDFIKERDGNRCLNPDCWGTSKRLSIHHIDYNKKNCEPQNLITLCTSCNSRANKDRLWHEFWYKAIIYRRYMDGCNVCA